jgi:hypothetical protein
MIIHILITIGFFLVLMYLSVNLLGFLVRGLFTNPELDKLKQDKNTHEFIKKEIEKSQHADIWINIIALVLNIAFFYLLFRIWNIGVAAVAVIIMAGRLPDLIWDIKHGRRTDPNLMKKNFLYYASAFLPWLGLPVLYYSLYYL